MPMFHVEQVVCPPVLKGSVFTTAAVDNLDHKPSATTASDSFHETGISLLQHPVSADEGVQNTIVIIGNAGSRSVGNPPHFYTDVPRIACSVKQSPVPVTSVTSLKRDDYKEQTRRGYRWLENTRHNILEENTGLRSSQHNRGLPITNNMRIRLIESSHQQLYCPYFMSQ